MPSSLVSFFSPLKSNPAMLTLLKHCIHNICSCPWGNLYRCDPILAVFSAVVTAKLWSTLSTKKNKTFSFFNSNPLLQKCKIRTLLVGWQAFPIALSHLYFPLPSCCPSSNPSIHLCSLALCGESAVTVCPSSCGPSCLGQMGSSPPHPPSSMMSIRGPLNLKPRTTGPEVYNSHWAKTIWEKMFMVHSNRQMRCLCNSHYDKTQSCNGCILLIALELKYFYFKVITLWFATTSEGDLQVYLYLKTIPFYVPLWR